MIVIIYIFTCEHLSTSPHLSNYIVSIFSRVCPQRLPQQPVKDRCFENEASKYGEDVDLLSLLHAFLLVREQFLEGFGNLLGWSSFYEDSVVRVSYLSIAASSMVGRSRFHPECSGCT